MRTIDPKTALVFSGFSQRQLQLIMLSDELTADLVSEPKFTQQIRRCQSVDTLTDKDRFKEIMACLQIGPAKYSRQFFSLNCTAHNYTRSMAIKLV